MSDPALVAEALRVSGRLHLRVSGTSMLPAVWPGDLLTIQPAVIDTLPVGALILYSRERRLWVHRVVGAAPHGLTTRGDALSREDPVVYPEQILGRVTSVLHRGCWFAPPLQLSFAHRLLRCLIRRFCPAAGLLLRWRAYSGSART